MMLPPDVAALVDTTLEATAREAYVAALARLRDLRERLTEADGALAAATAARGELMRRSVTGDTIKPGAIAEAERKVREVEIQRMFVADTIAGVEASTPRLDRAIAEARGQSHRGVFVEGVRRRFAAGERVLAARQALATAEGDLAAANGIINAAVGAGFPIAVDLVEPLLRSTMPTPAERSILARDDLLPEMAA